MSWVRRRGAFKLAEKEIAWRERLARRGSQRLGGQGGRRFWRGINVAGGLWGSPLDGLPIRESVRGTPLPRLGLRSLTPHLGMVGALCKS